MSFQNKSIALLMVSILTGCGGTGNGSESEAPPLPSPPAEVTQNADSVSVSDTGDTGETLNTVGDENTTNAGESSATDSNQIELKVLYEILEKAPDILTIKELLSSLVPYYPTIESQTPETINALNEFNTKKLIDELPTSGSASFIKQNRFFEILASLSTPADTPDTPTTATDADEAGQNGSSGINLENTDVPSTDATPPSTEIPTPSTDIGQPSENNDSQPEPPPSNTETTPPPTTEPGSSGENNEDLTGVVDYQALYPAPGCWNYSETYPEAKHPQGQQKIDASLKKAFPSNRWWSSLAWQDDGNDPHSGNIFPHPLAAKAQNNGLKIGYPSTASIGGNDYGYFFSADLRASVEGLDSPDTKLLNYSDWGVTGLWQNNGKRLEATLNHGSPFVYFKAQGGAAEVELQNKNNGLSIWHNDKNVLAFSFNGHHYALFSPTGTHWNQSDSKFIANLGDKDYFSIALLPDAQESTLSTFQSVAFNFVVDTQVDWQYDEKNALLDSTYHWVTQAMEGDSNHETLFALMPHQWKNSNTPLTAYTYPSARGKLKLAKGSEFTVSQRFHGVLPALPDAGLTDSNQLAAFLDEATQKVNFAGDTYFGGKDLAKFSNLLALLDQQGKTEQRNALINKVKNRLQDWFDASNQKSTLFNYDNEWKTLIGYPASFGSDTTLNDHHFHWGYFIQASAALARYDQAWAADSGWGGLVKMLIRDAANPNRDDAMFPFLRNFDPYEGHAWAGGSGNYGRGNNQESSSESMNFSTGLILWGEATANKAIRDLGIFLYTTENAAIDNYWFNVDNDNYPAGYSHATTTIVWSDGGVYATWWTGEPEAIHGINFLPLQGGSLYLGHHPDYLSRNYEELIKNNGGPEGTNGDLANSWTDVIWEAQAFFDPQSALDKFTQQVNTYAVESGETKAHTYHWISSLSALGQVDTGIWADIPTAAVFKKGSPESEIKTLVAYNEKCVAKTVHFSNGANLEVPAKTMLASQGNTILGQWPLGSCDYPQPQNLCSSLPDSAIPSSVPSVNNDPSVFYLSNGGLANPIPAALSKAIAANTGNNVNSLPGDAKLLVTYEMSGLSATYNGGNFDFTLPLNSDGIGNATQAKIEVDNEGDGVIDFSATYNFYAVDAASGTVENYTAAQGIASSTGSLKNLISGKVRITLWNAFGGEDVFLSEGSAFLKVPYQLNVLNQSQ